MYFTSADCPWADVVPGVRRQTVCHGERAHMIRVTGVAGATVPAHSHPHEQIGTVVSGSIELTIGDGPAQRIGPGDGYAIPGGVLHSAFFPEDALLIEIFAPVRQEYLP